jgi:hypothetical protein
LGSWAKVFGFWFLVAEIGRLVARFLVFGFWSQKLGVLWQGFWFLVFGR